MVRAATRDNLTISAYRDGLGRVTLMHSTNTTRFPPLALGLYVSAAAHHHAEKARATIDVEGLRRHFVLTIGQSNNRAWFYLRQFVATGRSAYAAARALRPLPLRNDDILRWSKLILAASCAGPIAVEDYNAIDGWDTATDDQTAGRIVGSPPHHNSTTHALKFCKDLRKRWPNVALKDKVWRIQNGTFSGQLVVAESSPTADDNKIKFDDAKNLLYNVSTDHGSSSDRLHVSDMQSIDWIATTEPDFCTEDDRDSSMAVQSVQDCVWVWKKHSWREAKVAPPPTDPNQSTSVWVWVEPVTGEDGPVPVTKWDPMGPVRRSNMPSSETDVVGTLVEPTVFIEATSLATAADGWLGTLTAEQAAVALAALTTVPAEDVKALYRNLTNTEPPRGNVKLLVDEIVYGQRRIDGAGKSAFDIMLEAWMMSPLKQTTAMRQGHDNEIPVMRHLKEGCNNDTVMCHFLTADGQNMLLWKLQKFEADLGIVQASSEACMCGSPDGVGSMAIHRVRAETHGGDGAGGGGTGSWETVPVAIEIKMHQRGPEANKEQELAERYG